MSSPSPLTTVATDTATGLGFLPVGTAGRSSLRLLALGPVAPLFGTNAGDVAGSIGTAPTADGCGTICKGRGEAGIEGNMVMVGAGAAPKEAPVTAVTDGGTGGPLNAGGHAAGPLNAGAAADVPAPGGGGAEKNPPEKGGGGLPAIAHGVRQRTSQT